MATVQATSNTTALRAAAVVYAVGLAAHTADHLRRGLGTLTAAVLWAGNLSTVLGVITVVLILRRHRWAPAAATAVGTGLAVGIASVHLLPRWGQLSDAFVGSRRGEGITGLSWTVVLLEIAGSILVAITGWRVWRADNL